MEKFRDATSSINFFEIHRLKTINLRPQKKENRIEYNSQKKKKKITQPLNDFQSRKKEEISHLQVRYGGS